MRGSGVGHNDQRLRRKANKAPVVWCALLSAGARGRRAGIPDGQPQKVAAVEATISRNEPVSFRGRVCGDEKVRQDFAPSTAGAAVSAPRVACLVRDPAVIGYQVQGHLVEPLCCGRRLTVGRAHFCPNGRAHDQASLCRRAAGERRGEAGRIAGHRRERRERRWCPPQKSSSANALHEAVHRFIHEQRAVNLVEGIALGGRLGARKPAILRLEFEYGAGPDTELLRAYRFGIVTWPFSETMAFIPAE